MYTLQRGFTLVELVIVIAIISIVSVLTSARFMQSDVFETRGSLGTLVSSLRYAHQVALAQHRSVYVVIDNTLRTLRLCYDANCQQMLRDPVTQEMYQASLGSQVHISASTPVFAFSAYGHPIPNVSARYVVDNINHLTPSMTVQIEADTGYVRQL